MAITIKDVDGRHLTLAQGVAGTAESVFVDGPRGLCMEFDRRTLIDALKREFGFVEEIVSRAERHLYRVSTRVA